MIHIFEYLLNLSEGNQCRSDPLCIQLPLFHPLNGRFKLKSRHPAPYDIQLSLINHRLCDLLRSRAETHGNHPACVAQDARLHAQSQRTGEAGRIKGNRNAMPVCHLMYP